MKVIQIAQKQILYTYERFEGFGHYHVTSKLTPWCLNPIKFLFINFIYRSEMSRDIK